MLRAAVHRNVTHTMPHRDEKCSSPTFFFDNFFQKKTSGRSLSGPFSLISLDDPRYSINGVYLEGGREIAAISFAKNPSMADIFERKYEGLRGRPLMHAQKDNNGWNKKKTDEYETCYNNVYSNCLFNSVLQ